MATVTVFPNGIGTYTGVAKGGSAGAHTLVVGGGVTAAVGDIIQSAIQIEFDTSGDVGTIVDLTSEFTSPIETASTADNTGGTATTGALLLFQIIDQDAGV